MVYWLNNCCPDTLFQKEGEKKIKAQNSYNTVLKAIELEDCVQKSNPRAPQEHVLNLYPTEVTTAFPVFAFQSHDLVHAWVSLQQTRLCLC